MTLALDISTKTGWARRTKNGIIFGTHDFSTASHDLAVFGRRFHWWLTDLIAKQGKPSEVVIERPFFHPKHPLVGAMLYCICHEAHRVAEMQGIPRDEYTPNSIKKFITGHGWAKKPEVMAAVRKLGHKITTEHEADAVALLLLREYENKKTKED